jgi:hypothetical protein
MWQAEELFRRGARTLSQDLDRHFERKFFEHRRLRKIL